MFHDVLPDTAASGGGPERFAVSLSSFERALDVIAATGRRGCSLSEALQRGGEECVAITFDDGTRSHFDHAAPALVKRGMTATFFVTTDWVGTPGYLTWEDLRQLVSWGMSVQSHTRSHPFLSELDARGARAELVESKAALDEALDQQTNEIALPGGDAPSRRLRESFAEAGYDVVATSRWGANDETSTDAGPLYVKRCTVRGDVSAAMMRRIIAADPWVALRRSTAEAVRARIRSTLGASRYARWRRRFLDALSRTP